MTTLGLQFYFTSEVNDAFDKALWLGDTDNIPEMLSERGIEYFKFSAFDFEVFLPVRDNATFIMDAYLSLPSFVNRTGLLAEQNVYLGDGLVVISAHLVQDTVKCETSHYPKLDISLGRSFATTVSTSSYIGAWTRVATRIVAALRNQDAE